MNYLKFICLFGVLVTYSVTAQVTTFGYTGAAETYIVPPGVSSIEIEASGAQGGNGSGGTGGLGATMIGTFTVTGGDVLTVVVGQQGLQYGNSGGGGGGSGVIFAGAPMIVAGGGGGAATNAAGMGGVITENGGNSSGLGGTPGNGGQKGFVSGDCGWAAGGGGFYGNGYGGDGGWDGGFGTLSGSGYGRSWVAGGLGGSNGGCSFTYPNAGAWGCGGGGAGSYGGAGGGGYSGGGGGQYVDPSFTERGGGGGGSFNDGTDQLNTPSNRSGAGQVIITVLCNGLITDIPTSGVCIGEELTLSATSTTGGVITWSGGVLNGVPFTPALGTFTYTATSSSASDCNFSIDISASEVPDITAHSSTPGACEGALITVWGEGGDTYTWTGDGDVTPIDSVAFVGEEGTVTYTVIGSILGCEGPADEIVISGAAQPDVIATATPALVCLGDPFILAGDGVGAAEYDWGGTVTDGDEVLVGAAGTYIYFVVGTSDAGCSDTAFVTVVVNPLPIVNAGLDKAQCTGMTETLSASGALTYVWSPAIVDGDPFVVASGPTTYTVIGTDVNGCEGTDDVVVTGIDYPAITAVVTDEYALFGASIDLTVTGGSGSYGYSWSHGPTTEDVTGLYEGSYMVTVDDVGVADGICTVVDSIFVIKRYVGVNEIKSNELRVYPSPTNDIVTIETPGNFSYEVTALNGAVILKGSAFDQELINLVEFAAGTYLITVTVGHDINTVKVIKN